MQPRSNALKTIQNILAWLSGGKFEWESATPIFLKIFLYLHVPVVLTILTSQADPL